jgi:hypothetical protein
MIIARLRKFDNADRRCAHDFCLSQQSSVLEGEVQFTQLCIIMSAALLEYAEAKCQISLAIPRDGIEIFVELIQI